VVQDYLGSDRQFYQPSDQGAEKGIKERLEHWKLEIKKQKGAPHQPQNQKGIDAKE
jgi:hypothetical protein